MDIEDIADSIYELAEDAYWDIREGSVDSARDKLMEIKSLAKDIMNTGIKSIRSTICIIAKV